MSIDKFKIDSHKMIYHPKRVAEWQSGGNIYPIYVEIGPSGACNLRCKFCSVDYIGYQNRYLKSDILRERLAEMAKLGVKSVMYAGEGEPLLHSELSDIIKFTKEAGIDVALTTNGVLMNRGIPEKILVHTEWIKVSCNAGTAKTYAYIHNTRENDFDKVIENLTHTVQVRQQNGYSCSLGVQILLLPENEDEVVKLATIAKDIGLDYLVVKPYTRHSHNDHEIQVHYGQHEELSQQLQQLNTANFHVVFRTRAMQEWDEGRRSYTSCLALPFWAHIDAGGNVWGCGAHLENEAFLFGNINEQTFQEIWEGDRRRRLREQIEKEFDIASCRLNCRMDKVNQYLWQLQNPVEHVNFI